MSYSKIPLLCALLIVDLYIGLITGAYLGSTRPADPGQVRAFVIAPDGTKWDLKEWTPLGPGFPAVPPPPVSTDSGVTLAAFMTEFTAAKVQPLQLLAMTRVYTGMHVTWEGFVCSAHVNGKQIALNIAASATSEDPTAYCVFTEEAFGRIYPALAWPPAMSGLGGKILFTGNIEQITELGPIVSDCELLGATVPQPAEPLN